MKIIFSSGPQFNTSALLVAIRFFCELALYVMGIQPALLYGVKQPKNNVEKEILVPDTCKVALSE